MAETMAVTAVILFTMAGLSAALAGALWFLLGIGAVIKDLSGNRRVSRGRPGRGQGAHTGQTRREAEPARIKMLEEIILIHTKEEI
ncbi:MAG: hypothetical protein HFI42_00185 [Lachnospiraceae bacterium]|nr:hypothetical protein [Lachnospiraceae bacterium]MCI9148903.1 hypothetical protein [Lachnospiraceae bacterium]